MDKARMEEAKIRLHSLHTDLQKISSDLQKRADYTSLNEDFRVDLKYATTDNFLGLNVYGPFTQAFLHKTAFQKLTQAKHVLNKLAPGTSLLILDTLRPNIVQKLFWNIVEGTPSQHYFANPDRGSLHSFGFAIDLTLCDPDGTPLDMGTPFDDFTELAQPRHESHFLNTGHLTPQQISNRELLRTVMFRAGFTGLDFEWWHFDALPRDQVVKGFEKF